MKKWKNFMAAALIIVMTAVLAFPATEVEAASAPKKTRITYLKSQSAGKVTVKYSKVKGAKYQIQVATNSKMSKGKKSYKTSAVSKTVSLKKGKKYWVRVRTYKKVGKKIKYSKWSAKKAVTVRKTGSVASKHYHDYTIPVTEKRMVMRQVPFSQAKYPHSGEFNKNSKDYYQIRYYCKEQSADGKTYETCLDFYSDAEIATMIASGKENWTGWIEKKLTYEDICNDCGEIITGIYNHKCTGGWHNSLIVVETIEHKATPTTQTVTVGKKCSCGKIRYN